MADRWPTDDHLSVLVVDEPVELGGLSTYYVAASPTASCGAVEVVGESSRAVAPVTNGAGAHYGAPRRSANLFGRPAPAGDEASRQCGQGPPAEHERFSWHFDWHSRPSNRSNITNG